MDMHCLEALQYQIVYTLCREGNYVEAASKIADLVTAMDRLEAQSGGLYVSMAQVFSKLVRFYCVFFVLVFRLFVRFL